jgi:hypothetical protein
LRIGDDHRGIKGMAQAREESIATLTQAPPITRKKRFGLRASVRKGRHIPHRHRQIACRNRHLQFHGGLGGPHAGCFLLGDAEDFVNQSSA